MTTHHTSYITLWQMTIWAYKWLNWPGVEVGVSEEFCSPQGGEGQEQRNPDNPSWLQASPPWQGLMPAQGYSQTQPDRMSNVSRTSGRPMVRPSSSISFIQPWNAELADLTPCLRKLSNYTVAWLWRVIDLLIIETKNIYGKQKILWSPDSQSV